MGVATLKSKEVTLPTTAVERKLKLPKVVEALKYIREVEEETEFPTSAMMQVIKYGKTFKRVAEIVEYNLNRFDEVMRKIEENSRKMRLSKTYYRHWWEKPSVYVPKEDVEEILKPLDNLGLGEFKFYKELRTNLKISEAVLDYVEKGRVIGKMFYDEKENKLVILSSVISSTGLGKYYTMFLLKPSEEGLEAKFFCTCPWAKGDTLSRDGRNIPPEYTSLCKHGIATLFYYYPEITTYIKLYEDGKLSKINYATLLGIVKKKFDETVSKMENYIGKNSGALEVVTSNVAYILTREVYRKLHKLGNFEKLVPSFEALGIINKELWNSIEVKRRIVGKPQETVKTKGVDIREFLKKLRELGIYDRLDEFKKILNGLQGSRKTTLYTKALLAGLVLGSDLETDPVIVSVVGDPGTGKTLTVEGLGKLLGIRTIVVERDVTAEMLKHEVLREVSKRISKYFEFFRSIVEAKIPESKRNDARRFFEEFVEKTVTVVGTASKKELKRLSKHFAEAFASLYGISSEKAKVKIGKLFYAVMLQNKKLYETYSKGKAVERKALDVRREMLERVAELGLIVTPEEKENVNSGSVRWEVLETSAGYKVRIKIDLHYLIRKCEGNLEKIVEIIDALEKLGNIRIETERPGLAELKLSESEYLEKALRVREEDILSPARRLIWVGGELTKKAVILIDESRRAPELLERLLTDLSSAARDTRRTNVIVTTDNAEPLMEAESDPRLDAFHSRVNFEVVTPSPTVAFIIKETLKKPGKLELKKKLPLLTLDELLLLKFASEYVKISEKYEAILYSIPMLLIYDFRVYRPEAVRALVGEENQPPLIDITPKGAISVSKGDYVEVTLGENVPAIRMMPERRFGHHVVRASKALAVINGKDVVDEETFLSAVKAVLLARVIPAERQFPYLYIDSKRKVADALVKHIRAFLRGRSKTLELIDVLGSLSEPSIELVEEALNEMSENPVAVAVFVRFLAQMLVSEHAEEFIALAKKVPGLMSTLDQISRYEKLAF